MTWIKHKILFIMGLAAFMAFSLEAAPALDLSGGYSVTGTNPDDQSEYEGEVQITRTGETYRVIWEVGTVYAGTGIVIGNTFSVAYVDEKLEYVGIVAYKILKNGDLMEGQWASLGGENLGTEILKRK